MSILGEGDIKVMAIYHFRVQMIKRNEGRSAVAAVAYRSASKIHSVYDDKDYDFTNKRFVEYSEISLPDNAPEIYNDRATLWNSVEMLEKAKDAQLAREFEISLPVELTVEQNIELAQRFINEVFVAEGMIADWSLHNPAVKDDLGRCLDKNGEVTTDESKYVYNNPHIHVMTTLRPLNDDGSFANKTEIEYKCVKAGEERGFTAEEFQIAKEDGWQKQYRFFDENNKKVWLTDTDGVMRGLKRVNKYPKTTNGGRKNPVVEVWNSKDTLKRWRKDWEEYVNAKFIELGIDARIDSRSFKEQGRTDEIPKFYIGRDAYNYEKKLQRLEREGKKVIHTDVRNLYDKTTAYNDKACSYRKEIDSGVNLLVTQSEKIKSRIDKNEHKIAQMSKELARVNDKIQTSTDNYNSYQAELNDALDRYNDWCNKLIILTQEISENKIRFSKNKKLVREKKALEEQIKVLGDYIRSLKNTYGDVFKKGSKTGSCSQKDIRENVRTIDEENENLKEKYFNMMSGADADIEDKINSKLRELNLQEKKDKQVRVNNRSR